MNAHCLSCAMSGADSYSAALRKSLLRLFTCTWMRGSQAKGCNHFHLLGPAPPITLCMSLSNAACSTTRQSQLKLKSAENAFTGNNLVRRSQAPPTVGATLGVLSSNHNFKKERPRCSRAHLRPCYYYIFTTYIISPLCHVWYL